MLYIIGDIHGEINKLRKLVENITRADNEPTLVFIGDYVDKGENVRETLDYLVKLSNLYDCKFLIGNHEYMWLEMDKKDPSTVDYLKKYGGIQTQKSFDTQDLYETRDTMMAVYGKGLFDKLVPFFKYKNFLVSHSGISSSFYATDPDRIPVKDFLFNRYDFISYDSLFLGTYKIIFGHTGFFTPYYDGYKIGIDTSACFLESQPLTAFNADEEYFINSDNVSLRLDEIETSMCPNIVRSKPWRTLDE